VSCPSSTFCIAIDHYGWYEMFDGTAWSAPARIVPDSDLNLVFPLGSYVSCLSSTFCMAVESNEQSIPNDGAAQDEIWDGTSWSQPSPLPMPHATSLACASQTLCFTTDGDGNISTYANGSWTGPVSLDPAGSLWATSCASATFCMTVGEGGGSIHWAYQFDGTSWSASPNSVSNNHPYDVSCPTTTYCMAAALGAYETFDGTSWSKPQALPMRNHDRDDVSCAQAGTCMVASGSYWEEDIDGVWQTGHLYRVSKHVWPEGVACPAVTDCVATISPSVGMDIGGVRGVEGYGYASVFDGAGWSHDPTLIDPARDQPTGTSCPRPNACVVVDGTGWASTTTTGVVNPPFQLDDQGSQQLNAVTCASTSFCMAADAQGRVATFDFAGHTSLQMVDPGYGGIRSISCGAPTLCMAVTHERQVIQYDGTAWSAPFIPQPGFIPSAVSCSGASFCMAVGQLANNQAEATSYDGASWSSLVELDGTADPYFVGCGSPNLCGAVTNYHDAQVYSPLGCESGSPCWGPATELQPDSQPVAFECGRSICLFGTGSICCGGPAQVNIWQDGTWSADRLLSDEGGIEGAACAANDTCAVTVRDFDYIYHSRG
jgi:hypothetical protein